MASAMLPQMYMPQKNFCLQVKNPQEGLKVVKQFVLCYEEILKNEEWVITIIQQYGGQMSSTIFRGYLVPPDQKNLLLMILGPKTVCTEEFQEHIDSIKNVCFASASSKRELSKAEIRKFCQNFMKKLLKYGKMILENAETVAGIFDLHVPKDLLSKANLGLEFVEKATIVASMLPEAPEKSTFGQTLRRASLQTENLQELTPEEEFVVKFQEVSLTDDPGEKSEEIHIHGNSLNDFLKFLDEKKISYTKKSSE